MYSGETQNYKLPQFAPTDAVDPIADFNPAFETIDAKLYEVETSYSRVEDMVATADASARAAERQAQRAENAAVGAESLAQEFTDGFNQLKSEVEQLHTRVDGLEAMNAILLKRIEELERSE